MPLDRKTGSKLQSSVFKLTIRSLRENRLHPNTASKRQFPLRQYSAIKERSSHIAPVFHNCAQRSSYLWTCLPSEAVGAWVISTGTDCHARWCVRFRLNVCSTCAAAFSSSFELDSLPSRDYTFSPFFHYNLYLHLFSLFSPQPPLSLSLSFSLFLSYALYPHSPYLFSHCDVILSLLFTTPSGLQPVSFPGLHSSRSNATCPLPSLVYALPSLELNPFWTTLFPLSTL